MTVKYSKRLAEQIDRGREGKNIGISMGMPRLEEHIYGLTDSTYTVLFGKTGSGKTSIALYCYLYRPLLAALADGIDFKIIYFSLEMKKYNISNNLLIFAIVYIKLYLQNE